MLLFLNVRFQKIFLPQNLKSTAFPPFFGKAVLFTVFIQLLLFHAARCDKAGHAVLVQKAFAVCVFINIRQHKSSAQLAANLFVQCVRKLHAEVQIHRFPVQRLVFQGVIRQRVFDNRLVLIKKVIDAVIKPDKQNAARL